MTSLRNKTAIITGASTGIGAAITTHLAMEGVDVCLIARGIVRLKDKKSQIKEVAKGNVIALQADISNRKQIEEAVQIAMETFGKVDFYVNNAGRVLPGAIDGGRIEDWEEMIDVNIKGVLYGIHAVLPKMKERASGHIVNVSSVSGLEVSKTSTVYSATKFAVRAISMGLEKELARTGVRSTNISPGMVQTDAMTRQIDQRVGTIKDRTPLSPEDIARAVIYAVSQPSYVNVNEITVRPV